MGYKGVQGINHTYQHFGNVNANYEAMPPSNKYNNMEYGETCSLAKRSTLGLIRIPVEPLCAFRPIGYPLSYFGEVFARYVQIYVARETLFMSEIQHISALKAIAYFHILTHFFHLLVHFK